MRTSPHQEAVRGMRGEELKITSCFAVSATDLVFLSWISLSADTSRRCRSDMATLADFCFGSFWLVTVTPFWVTDGNTLEYTWLLDGQIGHHELSAYIHISTISFAFRSIFGKSFVWDTAKKNPQSSVWLQIHEPPRDALLMELSHLVRRDCSMRTSPFFRHFDVSWTQHTKLWRRREEPILQKRHVSKSTRCSSF